MREGDLVRLLPSPRLTSPWRDYAVDGTLMRVRAVEPRRRRGSVSVQPADQPRSFRHAWFDSEELEPLDQPESTDLADRLMERVALKRKITPGEAAG